MGRRRSFSDRSQLACHDLRLPLWVQRNTEDGSALVTQKLKNRNSPRRVLVTCTNGNDQDIGDRIAFGAFSRHWYLPVLGSPHNKMAAPQGDGHNSQCREVGTHYASWIVPTDIFPLRRSSWTSNETFCPSFKARMPARSRAVAWTNTSLLPSSGWMNP
jgi:hypothetical protein